MYEFLLGSTTKTVLAAIKIPSSLFNDNEFDTSPEQDGCKQAPLHNATSH